MRYFFESGVFEELSYAELTAVFELYGVSKESIRNLGNHILVVDKKDIDGILVDTVFNKLGGFVRYGQIIEDLDSFLNDYSTGDKVTFGISVVGKSDLTVKNIQKLANDIKRYFKSLNISSRFLLPKQLELNAAQIINNDVLEDGFELCILSTDKGNIYGKTLGIQNIEDFVHRDIDKPAVNIDMGVLPHKLARIMVNLAQVKEGIIWDPFCGSGTILMEAATLGLDVIGTDIDLGAVEDTKKNINWLAKEGIAKSSRYNIFYLDIRNVERKTLKELKRTSIKAVICEPFMGPPQRRLLTDFMAKNLLDDVKKLYVSLFEVLNEISREGFKVVLILPSYKTNKGWQTFNISELIGKKWDVLNGKFTAGDLKWMRNNSIITRNIFVLSKR